MDQADLILIDSIIELFLNVEELDESLIAILFPLVSDRKFLYLKLFNCFNSIKSLVLVRDINRFSFLYHISYEKQRFINFFSDILCMHGSVDVIKFCYIRSNGENRSNIETLILKDILQRAG